MPGYFVTKARLNNAELKGAQLQQNIAIKQIISQVSSAYYEIVFLQQNEKELQKLDSIYSGFVQAATLRYTSGESNLLEKTTAETKRGEVQLKVIRNNTALKIAYSTLEALLNTSNLIVTPISNFVPLVPDNVLDSATITNNFSYQLMLQQAAIAKRTKSAEAAMALPELNIGYMNQSIIGFQEVNGADVYFNRSKRFTGFSMGITVPLTFFSNVSKVKSFSFRHQELLKEAENSKIELQSQLQNAFATYLQNLNQYNYFKNTAMPNADAIINTSTLAYRNGEINYLEYAAALENATAIRTGFLQSIHDVNQTVININSLTNK